MLRYLRTSLEYKDLIIGIMKTDFKSRYINSNLGMIWLVINPLIMILIYVLVFSQIMSAKLNTIDSSFSYSIYLCSGLILWNMFNEIIVRSTSMFLENANFIKKIKIPKLVFPLSILGSALINFFIVFFIFIVFLLIINYFNFYLLLYTIPILGVFILFAFSLGIFLGLLNVFIRDVGNLVNILMQLGFWATPVIYPVEILPNFAIKFLQFNPMFPVIDSFHKVMAYHSIPNLSSLLFTIGCAIFLLFFTYLFFVRFANELVDEL